MISKRTEPRICAPRPSLRCRRASHIYHEVGADSIRVLSRLLPKAGRRHDLDAWRANCLGASAERQPRVAVDIALPEGRCSAGGVSRCSGSRWATATVRAGPRRRWGRAMARAQRLFTTGGEVLAQGVVTVQDDGVRVGCDPVDDRVGEGLLLHPVVPLARRKLGAADRRGGLVAPVDRTS